MAYAESTSVSVERSQAEIQRLLTRYGADEIAVMTGRDRAAIGFLLRGLMVEIRITFPDRDAKEFRETPGGRRRRDEDAAFRAWEQACRARWRSLSLVLKAKLEAVDAGISTFEREFLPDVVVGFSDGRRVTIGDRIIGQLPEIASSGQIPRLLPERTN